MLGARVERGEDFGLGDADEIGAVDDVVLQARERAAAGGGFRLGGDEMRQVRRPRARAAFGSSRAIASSALARSFSTEARRASASISRARMTRSASSGERRQRRRPASPAIRRALKSSRMSWSAQSPIASETSTPKAVTKTVASQRAALRRGGRRRNLVDSVVSSNTSISAGVTTAVDLSSARGLLGGASASADARRASGSMRKRRRVLRGALMPDGLRSGTAARGRA